MRLPFVAIFAGCQWTRILLTDKTTQHAPSATAETPRSKAATRTKQPSPDDAARLAAALDGLPEKRQSAGQAPADAEAENGADGPELLAERLEAFMESIVELHDAFVAQLGEPQPQKAWDPEAAKTMTAREERISHGFFEDMKKFTTGRAVENADPEYQRERMRGMSARIDQQFHDVAGALRDFEDARYGRNGADR
jgi:hypothetical protein